MWDRTFGGAWEDGCRCVRQIADGYILGGYTRSFGAGYIDFWLLKTDPNGYEVWNRTFGGSGADDCHSIQQTADGGYILAGGTDSFGAGNSDFWMVKTDGNGILRWSRTFGGNNYDESCAVQQTNDWAYVLAGSTRSFGAGNADFWLVKTG